MVRRRRCTQAFLLTAGSEQEQGSTKARFGYVVTGLKDGRIEESLVFRFGVDDRSKCIRDDWLADEVEVAQSPQAAS